MNNPEFHNCHKTVHSVVILMCVSVLLVLSTQAVGAEVRRSYGNICHEKGVSPDYQRTSSRHAFRSVQACLASHPAARLPRNIKPSTTSTSSVLSSLSSLFSSSSSSSETQTPPSKTPQTQASRSAQSQMDEALDEAKREGRPFSRAYNRADYPHWQENYKGTCFNLRHYILKEKSLVEPVVKNCKVITGRWYDPYTDKYFTQSSDLDLDHLLPLAYFHARKGKTASLAVRERFANDPRNLILVDDATNQRKGAKGPSEFMPPNHKFRCDYLRYFDAVMQKYDVPYFKSEKRVINRMRKACRLPVIP